MNSLFNAALEFQNFIKLRNWDFCFIGGLAVIRWGEVRMTRDIDISILADFGDEEKYIDAMLASFQSRLADGKRFAMENRVLLVNASNGVPIDIAFAAVPFEKEMMKRATYFNFAPDCPLLTCSAEDLIVMKAFAARPQDWLDVEGIAARQGSALDDTYIFNQLTPLGEIKGDTEIINNVKRIMEPFLKTEHSEPS
ncbi:MAG: hypothetical protein A2219_03705 [Elusimicrobia bacterium RIFOXYA2_FULL_50_26]|nr:MAG: hypothetical protein A2219_03705 [Elusimicrobia bacterium RIFOXYA2_FULL_50_26]OGS24097.1 MAG: hypothetical protein A2314_02950 [Elusimicrobia bacterium RIFOXYB2_FULL_50_12]